MESFMGRLQYFTEMCSPLKSFNSESTIRKQQSEVKSLESTFMSSKGESLLTEQEYKEFRHKKLVLNGSTSPDTGEIIPWAMRTSAFVPTNIPIITGMLISPPGQFYTIFWQWLNQTYNAGLNYGNRNASSTQTNSELFQAYCIGTTTAVGVAGSLRALAPIILKGRTGGIATLVNYFIGYAAVASSSSINVWAMRRGEMKTGISVYDEAVGDTVGTSKIASWEAIKRTMTSRVVYSVPIFVTPAIFNFLLQKANLLPK